jgi:hypothetical protein
MSLAKTVINTAGDEEKTLAFNYSSLALNNGFFLDHLVRSTLVQRKLLSIYYFLHCRSLLHLPIYPTTS